MTWSGVLEITAGSVAIAMAAVAFSAGPGRRSNQALALLLFIDGIGWFGIADGLADFFPGQGLFPLATRLSLAASPWLYAWFIVETLDVPATQWARRPWIRVALPVLAMLVPALLITVLPASSAYRAISQYVGVISGPHIIVAGWGMLAAWQHHRSCADRQSTAYLTAFALRNIAVVLLFASALVAKQFDTVASAFLFVLAVVKIILLEHLAYLIYAVLSGQVLGLDGRVRATIQKGLVVIVVSSVFLVLTEGAEWVLGVDSPVMAIAAAGIITLVFQPLHHGAHRLAERLLPGPKIDARLRRRERYDLYRRQVEIAWMDGVVGHKERQMLDRLRDALGLAPEEANDIEATRAHPSQGP